MCSCLSKGVSELSLVEGLWLFAAGTWAGLNAAGTWAGLNAAGTWAGLKAAGICAGL